MIPVLFAFLGLVLVAACAEFLRHARWLDRAALISLVALSGGTRPDFGDHRTVVTNSIMSASPQNVMLGTSARAAVAEKIAGRLHYRDFLIFSLTTFDGTVVGVGLFDRVIVLGDLAGNGSPAHASKGMCTP
jgi:hypothetical protein